VQENYSLFTTFLIKLRNINSRDTRASDRTEKNKQNVKPYLPQFTSLSSTLNLENKFVLYRTSYHLFYSPCSRTFGWASTRKLSLTTSLTQNSWKLEVGFNYD